MIDKTTGLIICTNFEKGRRHDFRIYKESKLTINPKSKTKILADTAYKSQKYPEIATPHKKKRRSKKNLTPEPLTKIQKKESKELSSKRVKVENIIGKIKVLKSLAERYRNRRKRFGLRFNLISGLCNYELENRN